MKSFDYNLSSKEKRCFVFFSDKIHSWPLKKKTRKDGGTLCGWKWWKNHASRQDISVILRMCQVWHISVSICSFWALSHFQKKIATQLGWLQLGLFVLHFFGMNILVKISVSCYDHFVVDLIGTNSIHLGFYLPFEVCDLATGIPWIWVGNWSETLIHILPPTVAFPMLSRRQRTEPIGWFDMMIYDVCQSCSSAGWGDMVVGSRFVVISPSSLKILPLPCGMILTCHLPKSGANC